MGLRSRYRLSQKPNIYNSKTFFKKPNVNFWSISHLYNTTFSEMINNIILEDSTFLCQTFFTPKFFYTQNFFTPNKSVFRRKKYCGKKYWRIKIVWRKQLVLHKKLVLA